jgi:hypothetical protein
MKPATRAHENIAMRTLSVCHDHELKNPSRLLLELYLSAKFIIFTRHKKGAHILYTISKNRIKNQDNDYKFTRKHAPAFNISTNFYKRPKNF